MEYNLKGKTYFLFFLCSFKTYWSFTVVTSALHKGGHHQIILLSAVPNDDALQL